MRYAAESLRAFVTAVLEREGARGEEAAVVADALVSADLRGIHSHGVGRLEVYLERLRAGSIRPGADLQVLRDIGAAVWCDAQAGFGIVVAARAMDLAVERAMRYGVGAVGVRNSNHCGMLAYYVTRATERGAIGVALSNADAQVAPWGARSRYLGTNPIAIGIPRPGAWPLVLDMATSAVAHGRIRAAAERGEEIPLGWALDPEGRPTTDPRQALMGALLPFGGAKGSGLAIMVEILAGLLTGSASAPEATPLYESPEQPQRIGHFFLALWPETFCGLEELGRRVDRMVEEVHALPRAEGQAEVLLPGELEHRRHMAYAQKGIPLPVDVVASLKRVAGRTGVAEPVPLEVDE